MTKAIMVQGTASGVGKSVIVAALCRIFARREYRVSPFKAQNMALNSFVTNTGGEIGRSTAVQAMAAGLEPMTAMNPILLKPKGDTTSQLILMGKPVRDVSAGEYFDANRNLIRRKMNVVRKAYDEIGSPGRREHAYGKNGPRARYTRRRYRSGRGFRVDYGNVRAPHSQRA